MKKILLLFFTSILFLDKNSLAQNRTATAPPVKKYVHEYYLFIKGVSAKSDVIFLEKNVGRQKGVTFFMANRFPVRYFQLRTDRSVSKEEFASWMEGAPYILTYFGEGQKALEQIFLERKKTE